jgi:hypothetical protein
MANAFLSLMTGKKRFIEQSSRKSWEIQVTLRSHITVNNVRFIQDLDGVNAVRILLLTSQKYLPIVGNECEKHKKASRQTSAFHK